MQVKFLFDIANLQFEKPTVCSVNSEFYVFTNNDEERISFYNDVLKKHYGESSSRFIPKSVYAFAHDNLKNTDRVLPEQIKSEFHESLFDRQQSIESILAFLWLIKDNSIGIFSTTGIIQSLQHASRITKPMWYWSADGKKTDVTFSTDEIREAIKYVEKFASLSVHKPQKAKDIILEPKLDQLGDPALQYLPRSGRDNLYNKQNALDRSFNFILMARSQQILIYKIGYYMAAFESLFTTSSHEIQTKMAYRVAFYIADKKNRLEVFSLIENAYNIRSKFLHGQKFDKDSDTDINNLSRVSIKIDELLRKCFRKALMEDDEIFTEYSNSMRNAFLNNLVFDMPFDRTDARKKLDNKKNQEEVERESKKKKTLARSRHEKKPFI